MHTRSFSGLRSRAVASLLALSFALASCATVQETWQENPRAVLGTVVGAGVGVAAVAIGGGTPGSMAAAAAAGAIVGGYVGKKLDDRDKRLAAQAAQEAFENGRTGEAQVWNNPESGNSGAITPTQTYQIADGKYCRRYTQEIEIGGEKHEDHGTACRNANGVWEVQS